MKTKKIIGKLFQILPFIIFFIIAGFKIGWMAISLIYIGALGTAGSIIYGTNLDVDSDFKK